LRDIDPGLVSRIFIKNETHPERLPEGGFDWPPLSCTGAGPPWLRTLNFSVQSVWHSYRERPDLIITTHIHFSPAAQFIKKFFGIPYWVVAHGIDAWGVTDPALKSALKDADLVLAVSTHTRDRLLAEQRLNPDRVVILPNTMNENQYVIRPKPRHLLERFRLLPEQPVILTVARLDNRERYKGYDRLIEGMPLIREALPDVRYLLVGKGKDRSRIDALVKQHGVENCVTLAGYVPDEELCDYYNLCDVFAMPSKLEGFGIVFLEALACGRPVLAGNQDGSVDALCHGELGVLINPDRTDEIAETLIMMLRREYPHPLIYQPQSLRQRVIDAYGFDRFRSTIASYLQSAQVYLPPF
jgi:glycosyltransferase involved in cell wall biosynthesis